MSTKPRTIKNKYPRFFVHKKEFEGCVKIICLRSVNEFYYVNKDGTKTQNYDCRRMMISDNVWGEKAFESFVDQGIWKEIDESEVALMV